MTSETSAEIKDPREKRYALDIPALTFIKIFVALAMAYAVIQLTPLFLLISLSALLAYALAPLVRWMVRKKFPRWLALSVVVIALVGAIAGFVFGLVPELFTQISTVGTRVGPLRDEALSHIPPGPIRIYVAKTFENPSALLGRLPAYFAEVGTVLINSLWSVAVFLIVAIYFLMDGGRAYEWFLGFFRPPTQTKLHRTAIELQDIVAAYVGGQALTSLLVAIYTFVVLSIFDVPAALTLAVIAAIFDVLPIIGFLSSTICAVLMALTVSPQTALIIAAFYLGYQAFENYVVVPRVYGHKMKLSTLVVLLSFLIMGSLAGIPGALLVLPIVAAYPVVERIWLRRFLGEHVLQSHDEQATAGDKKSQSDPGFIQDHQVPV